MQPGHEGMIYRAERIFDKVVGTISTGLSSVAMFTLVACILFMVIYIMLRSLFNISWMFVTEFVGYFTVLWAMFALAYTLRTEGHIRIDAATRLLPKKARGILEVVTTLLSLVIVIYLTQKGVLWFQYGVEEDVRSVILRDVRQWPIFLLVPIGLASLAAALLLQLYCSVIKFFNSGKRS